MQDFKIRNGMFGTSPIIIHHNGRARDGDIGYPLKSKFFDHISNKGSGEKFRDFKKRKVWFPLPKSAPKAPLKDVSVVFYSNSPYLGSGRISLDYFGVEYLTICHSQTSYAHFHKLLALSEYAKSCESKYILYLDDFDIFCISDLSDLVDRFLKFDCDMLFQGDGWFWPRSNSPLAVEAKNFLDGISPQKSPYKYPNGGAFMVKTDFFNEVSEKIIKNDCYDKTNDQPMYSCAFKFLYPRAKVDYFCEIFQITPWTQWFEDRYGKLDLRIETDNG